MEKLYSVKYEKWSRKNDCFNCGKRYMDCEEIGQLNCSYHNGIFKNGKWNCCKSSDEYSRGCKKRDHMKNTNEGNWFVFDEENFDMVFGNIKRIKKFHEDAVIGIKTIHQRQYLCIRRSESIGIEECKKKFDKYIIKTKQLLDRYNEI
jgi:hypothetical protein